MKRILCLSLCFIMMISSLSLIGCNNNPATETFTVTFNSDGGTAVSSQTVNKGEKVSKPSNPTKTDYIFDHWSYNGVVWNFNNDTVNDNITLDANWVVEGANCNFVATEYKGMRAVTKKIEIEQFRLEGTNNNPKAVKDGIIVCPFYTMKINGKTVPVYTSRASKGLHSFCQIDVDVIDKEKDFNLLFEIKPTEYSSVLKDKDTLVNVLPESSNVSATISDDLRVSGRITKTGSYSVVFKEDHVENLTIFVTPKADETALFGDKDIVYLEPADYTGDQADKTVFNEENKVYYFKKGNYLLDQIWVPSNSVLYIEQGAFFKVMPSTSVNQFLTTSNKEKVTIYCRGIFDMSACQGFKTDESARNKKPTWFTMVDDFVIDGLSIINSTEWAISLNGCRNAHVKNCLVIGYRECSDGIMLSNCQNGLVEYNFVRTGDDVYEVKSVRLSGEGTEDRYTDNVVFQYNAVWADNNDAFGSIYESYKNTKNVWFKHNSVGFALGDWNNNIGCFTVYLGNNKDKRVENIHFEDIEIFKSNNRTLFNVSITQQYSVTDISGYITDIYFKNIRVKKHNDYILAVKTFTDDKNVAFIGDIYFDDVYVNGELVTQELLGKIGKVRNEVLWGYDVETNVHVNTLNNN